MAFSLDSVKWPPALFGVFTVFTRIVRIRNIAQDAELSAGARTGWLLLSGLMIGLALVVIWGAITPMSDAAHPINLRIWSRSVKILVGVTVLVWAAQIVSISVGYARGDRDFGFLIVHLVLAAVSVGLAYAAYTYVQRMRSQQ